MKTKMNTHRFINGTKNFINFPYLGLVLQIDWSIKERYFLIGELCHSITFTRMKKRRYLYK